jgi:hypothetical protein
VLPSVAHAHAIQWTLTCAIRRLDSNGKVSTSLTIRAPSVLTFLVTVQSTQGSPAGIVILKRDKLSLEFLNRTLSHLRKDSEKLI